MEYVSAILKGILLIPLGALIELPFVRLATRLVISKRLSLGAAYMLGLISGAATLIGGVLLWPFESFVSETVASVLSLAVAFSLGTFTYGYFLKDAQGASVGYLKGGLVLLTAMVMLAAALVGAAFLVVGLLELWKVMSV